MNRLNFKSFLWERWIGIFCALVLLAVMPSFLFWSERSALGFYWILLLISTVFVGAAFPIPVKEMPGRYDIGFCLVFTLAGFIAFFYQLNVPPLGLDEDMLAGRAIRSTNLLHFSALSQQPPLFYYLTRASLHFGGVNLWSIRAVPAVFGALSVPLFYVLLRRLGVRNFLAFAGAFLFLTDDFLLQHAREGRPYSVGIFFLLSYFLVLAGEAGTVGGRGKLARLTVMSLLCLFTLGAQLQFTLFVATISYALAFRNSGLSRLALLTPFCAFTIAFLLFSPFQWQLSMFYPHYIAYELFDPLRILLDGKVRLFKLLSSLLRASVYVLPFLAFMLVFAKRESVRDRVLYCVLLLPFMAIPIYVVFFGMLAEWMLQLRYLMLLYVCYLLALVASFELLASKVKVLVRPLWALALLGCIASLYSTNPIVVREQKWRGFYDYLKSSDLNGARGFMFSVSRKETHAFSGFPGLDFYNSPELFAKIQLNSAWDHWVRVGQLQPILDALDKGEEPSEILLFDVNLPGSMRLDTYKLSGVVEKKLIKEKFDSDAVVLRIHNRDGLLRSFERILAEIDAQEPREIYKFRILHGLASVRAIQRRCDEAVAYLARAEAIPGRYYRAHASEYVRARVNNCSTGGTGL